VLFFRFLRHRKGKKILDADVTCVCFGRLIGNSGKKSLMVQFLKDSDEIPEDEKAEEVGIFNCASLIYDPKKVDFL